MKALKIILLALVLIPLQAHAKDGRNLAVTSSTQEQKRFALVIGNDTYQHVVTLEKAANDARAMGKALEQAQFTTKVVVNASRTQMNMAINRFVDDVSGGGIGVFFFAGHGVQVNNQNFLIPVDLQDIQSEADIADQGVSLQGMQDKLAEARAKFTLLVIDACRNNPLPKKAGRALGGTRGLSQASSAEGQMVVFSAGANQQALDKLSGSDADPNGVFTREFLPLLSKPGVSIRDTVLQVRRAVRARAKSVNHEQFPAIYDQAEGNFYFVGDGTQVASLVPVPAQPARVKNHEEIEQDAWESVKDGGNLGSINEYLNQYPQGRFAGHAKILMSRLKPAPAKLVEPATPSLAREDGETALWNEVQKGGASEDYRAYLAKHPKGKYDALAKGRLKKLDEETAQQARLEREATARQAAQQEQSTWENANSTASEESYQGYINTYPKGRYATLAQARIAKLRKEAAAAEAQQAAQARAEALQQARLEREAAAREHGVGQTFKDCPDCPEMVVLPKGSFTMGSSKGGDESPAHGVTIRQPFALGKTEITRSQFAAFVNATGHDAGNECWVLEGSKWEKRSGKNWRNPNYQQDDSHPAACINWNDAKAYAEWLSRKTGKQYRLPTESQWEYACRAGGQHEYCGSDNLDSIAWYGRKNGDTTHPAAQKQANAFGLYDMSGNVWEWTEDSYHDTYNGAPADGTAWSGDGAKRVLRGGSWYVSPGYARSAIRNDNSAAVRSSFYGFRVARTLQ